MLATYGEHGFFLDITWNLDILFKLFLVHNFKKLKGIWEGKC